jgi:hypothetical protein
MEDALIEMAMKQGKFICDTLISTPGSTMNKPDERDSEMQQRKTGNQW